MAVLKYPMTRLESYQIVADLLHRRITSPLRVLPNVFILGATKAGSTSLANMLWQHPAHVEPFTKELLYLQKLPGFLTNLERSKLWSYAWGRYENGHSNYSAAGYRKFFPTAGQMRQRRAEVGNAITSDCDPFNLYCEVATQRIASLVPDARFVISVREPVRRTFSNYMMHRTRAGDKRSFLEAINQEMSGVEKRFRKRFVHQSVYAPHVERWFKAFPRSQFLVVSAEELFTDAQRVANRMFNFLGLESAVVDTAPRNRGKYTESMDPAAETWLREYFRPFNQQLYDLLGTDLGWDHVAERQRA